MPTFTALLRPFVQIAPGEGALLARAFGVALLMFGGYAMLRPVREAMGVSAGVRALPALFWATFVLTLVLQPLYARLLQRQDRARALPWVYLAVALSLLLFRAAAAAGGDGLWLARSYYVWISAFNLLLVAVFWSLMAEVFSAEQAARLFAFLAGAFSLGGLLGPLAAALLAERIGTLNLLPVAAALIGVAGLLMARLPAQAGRAPPPLEGDPWQAFRQLRHSPYLRAAGWFVIGLTTVSTLVYVELQRAVGDHIQGRDAQTAFFARLDFWVQVGALTLQFLLFPRVLRALGFTRTLLSVPVLMGVGFAALALAPTLLACTLLQGARRISEFGLTRPAREMLYTVLPASEKYLAKGLIDSFIYRAGDALSVSLHALALSLVVGLGPPTVWTACAGIAVCLAWAGVARGLGQRFERLRG